MFWWGKLKKLTSRAPLGVLCLFCHGWQFRTPHMKQQPVLFRSCSFSLSLQFRFLKVRYYSYLLSQCMSFPLPSQVCSNILFFKLRGFRLQKEKLYRDRFFNVTCTCVGLSVCMCIICMEVPSEATRESQNPCNWTYQCLSVTWCWCSIIQGFCKSNKCPWLLSHLSSLSVYIFL